MFLILCNLGKAQNDRYVHFCLTFACKSLSLCSLVMVVVVLVYSVIKQNRIILFRSGSIIILSVLCCVSSVSSVLVLNFFQLFFPSVNITSSVKLYGVKIVLAFFYYSKMQTNTTGCNRNFL